MSEQKTIYAISSGDYSDYRVHAVFSTEELANEALVLFGKGFEVETLAMDPDVSALRQGLKVWTAKVQDGVWQATEEPNYYVLGLNEVCELRNERGPASYEVVVVADTKERALKAGTERIREYRALSGVTHAAQELEEKTLRDKALALREKYDRDQRIAKAKKAAEADFIYRNQGRIDAMMRESEEKRKRLDKEMGDELQRELKRIERETE